MLTRADYDEVFAKERLRIYPDLGDYLLAIEAYRPDEDAFLEAARVLACPVKANPPNWQHGRLVYHLARTVIAAAAGQPVCLLDIGTAKGFSALMMQWALRDAGAPGNVFSVDVIDPAARVARNTVAEINGLKTLREILAPWPEAEAIDFTQSTGVEFLQRAKGRIHFAFVDGKHRFDQVHEEATMLSNLQQPGDYILFDDLHIPGVKAAVARLNGDLYEKDFFELLPQRAYGICERV